MAGSRSAAPAKTSGPSQEEKLRLMNQALSGASATRGGKQCWIVPTPVVLPTQCGIVGSVHACSVRFALGMCAVNCVCYERVSKTCVLFCGCVVSPCSVHPFQRRQTAAAGSSTQGVTIRHRTITSFLRARHCTQNQIVASRWCMCTNGCVCVPM